MEDPQELVQLDRFEDIFSLKGKVVVVTGGSRGLGLQAASGLAIPLAYFSDDSNRAMSH